MEPKYTKPPPHKLNVEEEAYLKTLTAKELELHKMAVELLGSSYFTWKSHAYQSRDKK